MGIVARQSIKGTIINYIGVAVGFVTTFFVMTKYLTAEEVGLTRVLTDAAILMSSLAQLGTNTSAMRYYPYFKDDANRDNGFFGWTILIPAIGFVMFLILFFIFKDSIVYYFSESSSLFVDYLYFVIPMSFFMLYLTVFETNSNVLMRIAVPKFIREVGIRVFTLADYLLYAFDIITLDGMVIGLCLAYVIATLLNVVYLLSLKRVSFKIKPSFVSKSLRRDFLLYTFFLLVSSIVTNVPVINTFFISGSLGLAFTGVYTIAVYISNLVEMPYRSLGAISKPRLAQAIKDNDIYETRELCKSVSFHQLIVGLLVFFVITINIDLFYTILPNGEVYADGKWVFILLGIVKLFNSTLNIGVTVLSYSKYYYFSLFSTIILMVLNIIFNINFIPVFGMEGAALASLLSYAIYYVLILSLIWFKLKVSPFSVKQITVIFLIIILFAINILMTDTISVWFVELFNASVFGIIFEALLRTVILVFIAVFVIYHLKLSEQINNIIEKALPFIKK